MNFGLVGDLGRLERCPGVPWLTAGFFTGFAAQAFWLWLGIAVRGRRFTTVAAVESRTFLKGKGVCDESVKITQAQIVQFSGSLHGREAPGICASRGRGRYL